MMAHLRFIMILAALSVLALSPSEAVAGPNVGGVLILALSEGTTYTADDAPYCGSTTADECVSAVVSTAPDGSMDGPLVLNVLAAFFPSASPRVTGVTFGLSYTPGSGFGSIADFGSCGDFELPEASWPDPESGTAVTWGTAQTGVVNEVYWLAVYAYVSTYGTGTLSLRDHPVQGGDFADDSVPAEIDPILAFGVFGFGTFGQIPCALDTFGACCLPDGSCQVVPEADCAAIGGDYLGAGILCDPNPCVPLLACCLPDCSCELLPPDECEAMGGAVEGGDRCDPNPCSSCPPGACCFDDGACVQTTEPDCAVLGGSFLQDHPCDPNPCPIPGACCLPDGSCLFIFESECIAGGGIYQGLAEPCDPNPCVPVPTYEETWGKIKNRYR